MVKIGIALLFLHVKLITLCKYGAGIVSINISGVREFVYVGLNPPSPQPLSNPPSASHPFVLSLISRVVEINRLERVALQSL